MNFNRGNPYAYPDRKTGIMRLQNPQLEGRPILNVSVKGENVFQILAHCDRAMRDHGMGIQERRAIIKELSNVSDNDMFHARLRAYFTVLADQYPHIDIQATAARNPYVQDCDNCNDDGMMPDYNEGGAGDKGPLVPCDACGG